MLVIAALEGKEAHSAEKHFSLNNNGLGELFILYLSATFS